MGKYGLCIGINNYPGTSNDLSGCVNDANDWAQELEGRGFNVGALLDHRATKEAIVTGMRRLLAEVGGDDTVVITYSGHGTWQIDEDGDEPDRRDEALCPHDVSNGPLLDDELFEIFATRSRSVRLVFLSDSCHSGSVHKMYSENDQPRRVKFLTPDVYTKDPARLARMRIAQRSLAKGRARTGALLISGCLDLEYSYDASFAGRANGAFTRAALDTLRSQQPVNYQDWFAAIRTRLPSSAYPQTPNMVATSGQRRWLVLE